MTEPQIIKTGMELTFLTIVFFVLGLAALLLIIWSTAEERTERKLRGKPMSWDYLIKGVFYNIISIGIEKATGNAIATVEFITPNPNNPKSPGWDTVSVRINPNLLKDKGLVVGRTFSIANDGSIIKEEAPPIAST